MSRKANREWINRLLGDASRRISHAEALTARVVSEASRKEWLRAAQTEEEAACLLEIAGDEIEASVHRISAASCYQHAGEHFRAITLLQAALTIELPEPFRQRVAKLLKQCRSQASKQMEMEVAL